MKTFKIIIGLILVLLNVGCEEDVQNYDFEKYKFVSFIDQEISLQETYSDDAVASGDEAGYPIYLQYDGSTLNEDFTVELKITENFAQEGVDYIVDTNTVLFKAGEIRSEPFYIKTVDDLLNSAEDRSLEIDIESVSNPKIDIGVGIVNQSNKSFIVNILDNECSEELDIFTSDVLSLVSNQGSATVSGTFDSANSTLSLAGDLVAYGPLSNTSLVVTMNPIATGAKVGSVTFEDYYAGTDTDGWEYTYKQEGEGSFDICNGTIKDLAFGVYYLSGGNWVYWYSVSATISL